MNIIEIHIESHGDFALSCAIYPVVDWVHNDLLSLANLGGHTAGRQPRAIAWKSSGCTQRANAEREAERVARRFCVCEYFGEDFGKYFQKHSTK